MEELNIGKNDVGMNDPGIVQSRLNLVEEKIRQAWDGGECDEDIDDLVAQKHRLEGRLETLNARNA